uniref:Uncharacterized protein n=1 Tax=Acanthochromis polyacanthus TaxID=80966 RepID=A0A3Q1GH87_9TELE
MWAGRESFAPSQSDVCIGSHSSRSCQDICGYSSKTVYVCFKYKSNRRNIRKKIKCKVTDDKLTHLHMLILNRDLTYEVEVDNEKVESGSLEDDWENWPLKKIKHPKAKQPEDWDDRAKIDDADDTNLFWFHVCSTDCFHTFRA